ncbi:hypothetical protein [Burkholderia sp. MBR-1]|uniref:hypothetical protein n=1 Tax=Burkholderia sp. MBR-1 TaxID=2732364 RepID=UPI0015EE9022|nr:hypothetical protein [Burkholderia sp. MBR-1]QMI49988.1 hypothetical protein MBR110_31570 [Burkholderia sp. MBR-1]
MNKRDIKRVILGQLATYLRTEVILDGCSQEDLARAEEAQQELATEFERRCNGAQYSETWKC